jgi:hypothetical protein
MILKFVIMLLCASAPSYVFMACTGTTLPFYSFSFWALFFLFVGYCSKICGGLFYYIPTLGLIIGSNLVVACVLYWWCVECYFLQSFHIVFIIYHDSYFLSWHIPVVPKVLCRTWGIHDHFPEDPLIYFCNGYFEAYFSLIKGIMFC